MKSSRVLSFVAVTFLTLAAAFAAKVDMKDPRRAVGREDEVRVDAEMIQESVASGAPIGITYQIQNLSKDPIAVADKVCDVTFDSDDRAIVVSVGSDVPKDGVMPKLVVLAPNEKKTFTAGGMVQVAAPRTRNPLVAIPRFVRIKVAILRNLAIFRPLIDQQTKSAAPITLSDTQFEKWLENSDTIVLNEIPVDFSAAPKDGMSDASQRTFGGGID